MIVDVQSFGSHIRNYLFVQANDKIVGDLTLDKCLSQCCFPIRLLEEDLGLQI